jgi:hypothetical protein
VRRCKDGAKGFSTDTRLLREKIDVRGKIAVHRVGRQRTANLVHAFYEALVAYLERGIEDGRLAIAIENIWEKHRVALGG